MTGGGYFVEMLRMLLALAGVCVLAWVVLAYLARRGFGRTGASPHGEVLGRIALEPKRSLYIVRVEGRRLLIGVGEGGPPALVTELEPDTGEEAQHD